MMAAIFFFSSIPGSDMPRFGWVDLLVKKGGHALGYGLLALSVLHALQPLSAPTLSSLKVLLLAWAFTLLYAASDELHQLFVPGRTASWVDVMIDATGAFLGLAAFRFWRVFSGRKEKSF